MAVKKFIINMSVKTKLIFYYAIIFFIAIAVFTSTLLISSKKLVIHFAQQSVDETMQSTQNHFELLVKGISTSMTSFQASKNVQLILSGNSDENVTNQVEELENELYSLDPFQININNAELYSLTRDDFPALAESTSVFSSKELENDALFKKMINTDYNTSWYVADNINELQAHITASKLIFDVNTKKPIALLKINSKMSNFTDITESITLASNGKVFLCTSTHLVNPKESELGYLLTNNGNLFNKLLKKDVVNSDYIRLNDGNKYYVCCYPIAETGMFIVGAVDISNLDSMQGSVIQAIISTAVFVLIFLLILLVFISSHITKPLSELSKNMSNFKKPSENALTVSSKDEIGALYEAFNTMQNQINKLLCDVENEAKIRKQAELKALQAQITPHFLYNTLNSICSLARNHKAPDIEEMTLALSNFFVNSLNNGMETITLEKEVEHVLSYVKIQKIRYGDKFDININLPDELKNYLICKITLQPLVENCINHAFDGIDYIGKIDIDFKKIDNNIIITVSDNGLGELLIDPHYLNEYITKKFDENEPIEKYGIHNINQRIHLYFGNEYGLHYESNKNGGITVSIKIKAIKDFKGDI